MQATKRNMERIVEVVPDSDWQALQNFISHSPWDAFALMDQIAIDADAFIGGDTDSCLIIDETAFTKKGNQSVGVARQWNGRLGKVDNCQVGVFAALNCRQQVSLIATRLYLPEGWTDNRSRCQQAGVPDDRLNHYKKTDLALDMIASAKNQQLSYHWVGADAFYGNDPEFLRQLEQRGEVFMIDVHCDQTIYLADPQPEVPERKAGRGRTPTLLKTAQASTTVSQWASSQPEAAWQQVELRDSTQGKITINVLHRRVWLWDGEETKAHCWHLIVRQEPNAKNKLKYSLSNAASHLPISRLAFMQGQRYFVERAIEDAKSTAGLADYQVRGWTGWHHHMAMVMLAMLFMLKTKTDYHESYQLLSCNDIRELLYHFLPKRAITKREVLRQLLIRHKKRLLSIQYHYNKSKFFKSD
jgi:SRSO17 transposase